MAPPTASAPPEAPRVAPWQRTVGRWVLGLLAACAGAYLSVIALSALLLNTGAVGWLISQNTDDARLDLTRAYSPWPGRVVFRDLHLEVHDSASHFDLRMARGAVDVNLFALLGRRFEGRHLRGDGTRLRVRLAPAYRSAERETRLPRLAAPKAPSGTTRAADLWGVAVGIDSLTIDRLWVDDARLEGPIGLSGGFDLQPLDRLEITPSQISLQQSELWLGDSRLGHQLEGSLEISLPRTDVDQRAGERLSEGADVSAQFEARISSLTSLSLYLPEDLSLFGGEGALSVTARLRHQKLERGSQIGYRSPKLGVGWRSLRASGASDLSLKQRTQTTLDWSLENADVDQGSERSASIGTLERARLQLAAQGPLTELSVQSAAIDLKRAAVPELSALPLELPRDLEAIGGAASGDLSLRYVGGLIHGDTSLSARNLRVDAKDIHLRGDAWLAMTANSRLPFREIEVSQLNLDLRHGRLSVGERHSAPFRLALGTTRYHLNWKKRRASGPLKVELSDAQPLEHMSGAEVPGVAESLFGIRGLKLQVQTELSPDLQDVEIIHGSSGEARLEGRLVRRKQGARVVLLLSRGPLSVGIAAWPGDSSVVPLAGDDWLQEQLSRI